MHSIKISLITVVYNAEQYLKDCIESVLSQTYSNVEYIVIDGASTDGTLAIINAYRDAIDVIRSEKDNGLYDALNKGISLASGDVVGILNADDVLAGPEVLAEIAAAFASGKLDAIYGNLNYVSEDKRRVLRKWISKQFDRNALEAGWMPAHPTLYLKRELFDRYGNYSLNFGTAADYELMIRYLYRYQITAKYLNILIVNMRIGGISNANLKQRFKALVNDYKAIRTTGIPMAIKTLLLKKFGKIPQFFG